MHRIPKSIVLDQEAKFPLYFWKTLWKKLRIKLLFSTTCRPQVDGPFKVLTKVNDNVYKIDLPREFNVSITFNVRDLTPMWKIIKSWI